MDAVIGVDANQVGIERRVMDFRKGNAIRDDRLAELLVLVGDDVCRSQGKLIQGVNTNKIVPTSGYVSARDHCIAGSAHHQGQRG